MHKNAHCTVHTHTKLKQTVTQCNTTKIHTTDSELNSILSILHETWKCCGFKFTKFIQFTFQLCVSLVTKQCSKHGGKSIAEDHFQLSFYMQLNTTPHTNNNDNKSTKLRDVCACGLNTFLHWDLRCLSFADVDKSFSVLHYFCAFSNEIVQFRRCIPVFQLNFEYWFSSHIKTNAEIEFRSFLIKILETLLLLNYSRNHILLLINKIIDGNNPQISIDFRNDYISYL